VIEGVIVGDERPALRPTPPVPSLAGLKRPARQRAVMAHLLWAVGVVAVAIVIAIAFRLPIAEAFTDLAGLRTSYESLEFRAVRTELQRSRSGKTLVVEGEVANRTGHPVALPAIRLTLSAGGSDVHSWVVEPAAATVPPGGSIGFRSSIAPPDSGDGEVRFGFTARSGQIVGME
jgi:hypothetical protein